MPIPQFTNIITARNNWEPIYKNLYEVTLTVPERVASFFGEDNMILNKVLLLENITNIAFNGVYKSISTTTQKFKYSTRNYLLLPGDTHTTVEMKFNINQTEKYVVPVAEVFRKWYDLAWDSQTGTTNRKVDMIGSATIVALDKPGWGYRTWILNNIQMTNFNDDQTNYSFDSNSIANGSATFICDWWLDLRPDPR